MKEQKNLKINVPEGYEIDRDKSTFEEIVFKKTKKKGLPEKWEDLGEINGFWISGMCTLSKVTPVEANEFNKNIFATEAQAKASVALAQLSQLLKVARDGWEPDWSEKLNYKYCIYSISGAFGITYHYRLRYFLSFPTKELAEEFLSKYRDLIEEASPLLFG